MAIVRPKCKLNARESVNPFITKLVLESYFTSIDGPINRGAAKPRISEPGLVHRSSVEPHRPMRCSLRLARTASQITFYIYEVSTTSRPRQKQFFGGRIICNVLRHKKKGGFHTNDGRQQKFDSWNSCRTCSCVSSKGDRWMERRGRRGLCPAWNISIGGL